MIRIRVIAQNDVGSSWKSYVAGNEVASGFVDEVIVASVLRLRHIGVGKDETLEIIFREWSDGKDFDEIKNFVYSAISIIKNGWIGSAPSGKIRCIVGGSDWTSYFESLSDESDSHGNPSDRISVYGIINNHRNINPRQEPYYTVSLFTMKFPAITQVLLGNGDDKDLFFCPGESFECGKRSLVNFISYISRIYSFPGIIDMWDNGLSVIEGLKIFGYRKHAVVSNSWGRAWSTGIKEAISNGKYILSISSPGMMTRYSLFTAYKMHRALLVTRGDRMREIKDMHEKLQSGDVPRPEETYRMISENLL